MRSKTHGVDGELIREGTFRWVWYKLIPTNVSFTFFTLDPVDGTFEIEDTLPASDTYAAFMGVPVDFSYKISGSFSFTVKGEALPALAAQWGITDQAGLDEYERRLAREIEALAGDRLRVLAENRDTLGGLPGASSAAARVEAEVRQAFPDIENLSLGIHGVRSPDFSLYDSVRSLYTDYLARQQELLETEVHSAASRTLASQFRFDELAKYGELLTRYPILLQYLAIENGSGDAFR
jgi:hypothetical protein